MFSANTSQVSSEANWIESCFSSYLYTGNSTSGGTQTITNNVDLSTYGGMVWIKGRSAASDHILTDTTRGAGSSATNNQALASNLTSAEDLGGSSYDYLSSFSTTGFVVTQGGTSTATRGANYNNVTYASWTFRKQAKFFDVVTYTGTGSAQNIAHSLGSVPGAILIKRTDSTASWGVYHRSLQTTPGLENKGIVYLNLTNSVAYGTSPWNNTAPTSTQFTVGFAAETNASGATYVAYLFAHDAGGFGTAGTDNVISCGGVTLDSGGGNTTVNLGYEPQWILARPSNQLSNWTMFDNMRGWAVGGSQQRLRANLSNTEDTQTNWINITSTGFVISSSFSNPSDDVIYIAIRRGPMKTPTSGASVFSPNATTNDSVQVSTGFPVDLMMEGKRTGTTYQVAAGVRLVGGTAGLVTSNTNAEYTGGSALFGNTTFFADNTGVRPAAYGNGSSVVLWNFQRAPSFMDVVCYTGNSTAGTTQAHNLGVVPQLIIVKNRTTSATNWAVYSETTGATRGLTLNSTASQGGTNPYLWNSTTPTASVFSLGDDTRTNETGSNYVAYLFASCSGVSKVGSYTGTGTTLQIDCGFTGGARFVLIKKTSGTGSWYVWDSARGIVSGNDPYLLLNSTAAEVTNTDYVDTYSAGFEISSTAPSEINENGGTFIFFAVS